jgi:hypothetical protein
MPSYIARVELRGNPSSKDYKRLHKAMKQLGFLQTIIGSNKYNLPHGEYINQNGAKEPLPSKPIKEVREEIELAIEPISKHFQLIVAEIEGIAWRLNLTKENNGSNPPAPQG